MPEITSIENSEVNSKLIENKTDQSLTQEVYALYIYKIGQAEEKNRREMAEVKERSDKIRFINEIKQDINNLMDGQGLLNITSNEEIQNKLQYARDELGLKLPPADKLSFTASEATRLISNLHDSASDLEDENNLQMQQVSASQKMAEQLMTLVTSYSNKENKVISDMNRNMK